MPLTVKISQLPAIATPGSTDQLPISQAGTTYSGTPGQLSTDWKSILGSITAVTDNGNGSYTLTMSADNTGIIGPGTRLRTTRGTAAPNQAASLNGTTHYLNKTSPAGMTWTDDSNTGGWVKLSSYSATDMSIISRYNGTSGWRLYVAADGTVVMAGHNAGAANNSYVQSYQSVPLNKWVYVSAQLDMSAFTATTTTSYIMLDGADVPAKVVRGGTNPTALVQAGNEEVGSVNGGTSPFPGKITQVFVSSAKITQANMRIIRNQGLTAALCTTYNIASAYSLSNSTTDINTTNANNLTAQGGVTTTNADAPFGGQADGSISTTLDYAIVQTISSSSAVVQAPKGCTIATSGSISACSYATAAKPYGFPGQAYKWVIETNFRINTVQNSPVQDTWYNMSPTSGVTGGSLLAVPIGDWEIGYDALGQITGTTNTIQLNTLSTTSNSETDKDLTDRFGQAGAISSMLQKTGRKKLISLSSATNYYLNTKTDQASVTNINLIGSSATTIIRAINTNL